MPRAGQNVRLLALRRRTKAVSLFAGTVLLITCPLILPTLLQRLSPKSSAAISLPLWVYFVFFVIAGLTLFQASYFWKRANHADQGAAAEEKIAALLMSLQQQGWTIEYGIRHRSVGDIDVFLLSPRGQAYTIDVKSHRGTVRSREGQLYRQFGKSKFPFEKDFLKQAKQQAIAMKQLKGLKFVTAMVVFTDARVEVPSNPIEGVHVVAQETLLLYLRSLG